jgi:hypothetical protein
MSFQARRVCLIYLLRPVPNDAAGLQGTRRLLGAEISEPWAKCYMDHL